MEYTNFGNTGLRVSRVGLGCGGHSRLGLFSGSESVARGVVKHALDLGINFYDTARIYGTEHVVGDVLFAERQHCVFSTKTLVLDREWGFLPPYQIIRSLEKSLSRLRTDYIDIFNLHGVRPKELEFCLQNYIEPLLKEVDKGKIRYLGVTELFEEDTSHKMLEKALDQDIFDSVMVGFNLLNPSARKKIFPVCHERKVGTQVMFAVRRALSDYERINKVIAGLLEKNEVDKGLIDEGNPLGFVVENQHVGSIVEAAYRFCSREFGVDLVLVGTGSKEHLSNNVDAINGDALPKEILERLDLLFGEVSSVSGD